MGLISAELAIGILSGPGGMWWKMVMLPGPLWISMVNLAGIGLGWVDPWLSEKPPCPMKNKT